MSARVMYIVNIKIDVRHEQEFNRWHDTEHIPKVLAQPGFIQVRKFRSMKNNGHEAEYFVLYELRNQEAYEKYVKSEEGALLRQEFLDLFGGRTKVSRLVWQETLHLLK